MQKQRGKTEGKMTIDEIRAAATRLEGHAVRTPLLESELLNRRAGRRVLVKAECLQVTGSFKFRGAWSALTAIEPDRRAAGVIAFSSGNHAQGVAEAARRIGIPAVIVMPADAPAIKIARTRAFGVTTRFRTPTGSISTGQPQLVRGWVSAMAPANASVMPWHTGCSNR